MIREFALALVLGSMVASTAQAQSTTTVTEQETDRRLDQPQEQQASTGPESGEEARKTIEETKVIRESRLQSALNKKYLGLAIGDAIALHGQPTSVEHLPSGVQVVEWKRNRQFLGFLWPLNPALLTVWTDEKGVITSVEQRGKCPAPKAVGCK